MIKTKPSVNWEREYNMTKEIGGNGNVFTI